MIDVSRPRIYMLAETNLDPKSYHSVLIDLLRGLAALEVAAVHLRAKLLPSLKSLPDPSLWYQALSFFTGFGHQAVVIFFLLSGWLVGGSLLNKRHDPGILQSYTVDRLTRLWMVLIPCFCITILFGAITGTVDPTRFDLSPANEFSASAFLGNAVGLQNLLVPEYGNNFPLWSLTYEMAYYLLFPLALIACTGRSAAKKVIAATVAVLIASQLKLGIVLYFFVWLMGAAFSRVSIDIGKTTRTLLLAVFVVLAVYLRFLGRNPILTEDTFLQDVVYSCIFLVLLTSRQKTADVTLRKVRIYRAVGKFLAPFSFTLYVFHVPLLSLIRHINRNVFGFDLLSPSQPLHFLIYSLMLAVIVLCSYLLYLLFEAQTGKVRRAIKQMLSNRSLRAAGLLSKQELAGEDCLRNNSDLQQSALFPERPCAEDRKKTGVVIRTD